MGETDVRIPRLRVPVATVVILFTFLVGARLIGQGTLWQFFGSLITPVLATLVLGVWLLFFSRLPIRDRMLSTAVFLGVAGIAVLASDRSMRPYGLIMYALPLMLLLPTFWMMLIDGPFRGLRRWGTLIAIAVPLSICLPVRVDGLSGRLTPSLSLRWTRTPEQAYLESLAKSPSAAAPTSPGGPVSLQPGDWPGFRGLGRDGVAHGVEIRTDWPADGLPELWRRPVGPGWSSFALVDGRLYTQEQRGEEEAVVCMDADSGAQIWAYTYPARFYEVVANVGPRATPTFDDGRVYSLGATGVLTALDAATGDLLWQAVVPDDSGAEVPEWGVAASPLVVDGETVVVLAGEPGSKLIAYDAANGSVRWKSSDTGGRTYSSAALMTLGGVSQIVSVDGDGVYGWDPASGRQLWHNQWSLPAAPRIVQPLQTGPNRLVFGTGYGEGSRQLVVTHATDQWAVDEDWTSNSLKPYYNDFVLHEGYLYGFDDAIIACVDVETGRRQWKKGRYGFGQMLLIPEQDLLLVIGEKGQLVLLRASPDRSRIKEIASMQALDGKTWNHPVLAHGRLYLRNAQEAVCYDISP